MRGHAAGRVNKEVPGSVNASNCCVNSVFDPLAKPIHGEGNIDNKADDSGSAAPPVRARRIGIAVATTRLVRNVDRNQSDREPGCKGDRYDSSDRADNEHVPIFPRNIH